MALTLANIQLWAILCRQNFWKFWQVLFGKVRLPWYLCCRFYCMPLCILKNKKMHRGVGCYEQALPVQELSPPWWYPRTKEDPVFVLLLSCLPSSRLIFSLTAHKRWLCVRRIVWLSIFSNFTSKRKWGMLSKILLSSNVQPLCFHLKSNTSVR